MVRPASGIFLCVAAAGASAAAHIRPHSHMTSSPSVHTMKPIAVFAPTKRFRRAQSGSPHSGAAGAVGLSRRSIAAAIRTILRNKIAMASKLPLCGDSTHRAIIPACEKTNMQKGLKVRWPLIAAALLCVGIGGRAQTLIKDATFVRSPAGTHGGSPPVQALQPGVVGDGWLDIYGYWNISSNKLAGTTGGQTVSWLVRPRYESRLYQQMVVTQSSYSSSASGPTFLLSADPMGFNAILFWTSGTTAYIQYENQGAVSSNLNHAMTALVAGHSYTYTLSRVPNVTSGTDLSWEIYDNTAAADALAVWTTSGSAIAGTPTAGNFGVSQLSAQTYDEIKTYDLYSGASIIPGQFYSLTPSSSQVSFACSAPSGGTAPYTATLYVSSAPNQTAGTGGSTSTGVTASIGSEGNTTLTYTPSTSAAAYYVVVWTDSAGSPSTVQGPEVLAKTGGAADSVMFVGDSTGWVQLGADFMGWPKGGFPNATGKPAYSVPEYACSMLSAYLGIPRGVTLWNGCVSGTTSGGWAVNSSSVESNAVAGANAVGCTTAYIQLGANDAKLPTPVSAATYQANITSICNYILANTSVTQIVLAMPYYINANHPGFAGAGWLTTWSSASDVAIEGYLVALKAVAAANPTHIQVADRSCYDLTALHPEWQYDGVHPNGRGIYNLGVVMCHNLAQAFGLNPSGAGGVRRRFQ